METTKWRSRRSSLPYSDFILLPLPFVVALFRLCDAEKDPPWLRSFSMALKRMAYVGGHFPVQGSNVATFPLSRRKSRRPAMTHARACTNVLFWGKVTGGATCERIFSSNRHAYLLCRMEYWFLAEKAFFFSSSNRHIRSVKHASDNGLNCSCYRSISIVTIAVVIVTNATSAPTWQHS